MSLNQHSSQLQIHSERRALHEHIHVGGVAVAVRTARQEHRLRERAAAEGGDEGDGPGQRCALGRLVPAVVRHARDRHDDHGAAFAIWPGVHEL